MSHKRLDLGRSGEQIAAKYLRKKGFRILEQNYRTRAGEIDIIAKIGEVIVFTEVKTRKGKFLDSPLAAVTIQKQRQISKVALEYLKNEDLFDMDGRFDVIAVEVRPLRPPHIEHIEYAFDLRYG